MRGRRGWTGIGIAAATAAAVAVVAIGAGCAGATHPTPAEADESAPPATVGSLYAEAIEAHGREAYDTMLERLQAADRLAPELPALMYGLACAHALLGHEENSLELLEGLAAMDVLVPVETDADLESLRGSPRFAALAERVRATSRVIGRAERVATLEEARFLPEGVAHDPRSGDLFVSSVHRREILRVRDGKAIGSVAGPDDGLAAVLGMAVDADARRLWSVTAPLPQIAGGVPAGARNALVLIDLAGTRPLRRYEWAPAAGAPARFNDLALAPDGSVFVSDSAEGRVLRLPSADGALEEFLPAGAFRSPGGLTLSADGRTLWVADWSRGLAAVRVADRRIERVIGPRDASLVGIDGLRRDGSALVAIQNGIRPHRVLRLELSGDGARVERATILAMNHPDHAEPTLGTIVGERLVYVANSQWDRFTPEGTVTDPETVVPPILLGIPLRPSP